MSAVNICIGAAGTLAKDGQLVWPQLIDVTLIDPSVPNETRHAADLDSLLALNG